MEAGDDETPFGNLGARHRGDGHAAGVEVGLDEEGDVIKQARHQCGEDDLGIGHLKELGHQEGGGAHHRRHQLAAGRGDGLDGGGLVGGVAAALDHRDGDDAGGDDVGNGGTGDRAEQGGGDDGDLHRAATVAAHGEQRRVGEEARAAGGRQQRAEKNEGDDDGAGDRHRDAENAVAVEGEITGKLLPVLGAGSQAAGKDVAKHGVENEDDDDGHQHPAGCPSQRLEDQHNQDDAGDVGLGRAQEYLVDQGRIADGDVAGGEEAKKGGDDVVPGHATAQRPAARRQRQKGNRKRQCEDCGEELLRIEPPGKIARKIKRPANGDERQQCRRDISGDTPER